MHLFVKPERILAMGDMLVPVLDIGTQGFYLSVELLDAYEQLRGG
jgi:hypothetical protein